MKQLYNLLKCFRTYPEYFHSTTNNEKFVKKLDNLNVFIIEKSVPTLGDILQDPNFHAQFMDMMEATPLNTPFAMSWFEGFKIEGFPVPSPDFNYETKRGTLIGFGIQEDSPDYQSVHLYFEHQPVQKYEGFGKVGVYTYHTHHTFSVTQGKIGLSNNAYYNLFSLCYLIIREILMPMIKCKDLVFTEPTDEVRFKERIQGKFINIKAKPHNYIYITDKKDFGQRHSNVRTINKADHQYEVMGHWRTIRHETLGKDREGKRVVKGHTWVRPFVKGPQDAPLIKKIRKVK